MPKNKFKRDYDKFISALNEGLDEIDEIAGDQDPLSDGYEKRMNSPEFAAAVDRMEDCCNRAGRKLIRKS